MRRTRVLTSLLLCQCGSSSAAPAGLPKTTLDTQFRAEGVAVVDVDRDGHPDLATDEYWYAGPTFAPHEIRTPQTYDAATGYSMCQAVYADDVNADGFPDLLVAPFPTDAMYWYENPGGGSAHWSQHMVAPALSAGVETPVYVDLFGDGRHEWIMGKEPELVLGWFAPSADPTQPWTMHGISGPGFPGAGHFEHGLGVGDVDGDGRLDVLTAYGWFQQTSNRDTWVFHAVTFGPPDSACSTMYAYDFDGDGRADVLCARPHDYGLHWWQQQPDGTFVDHLVDDTISQMHAVVLDDIDGDGLPEVVTGKRWWAHGPNGDPGSGDPALLVAWSFRRNGPADVSWTKRVLDGDSGVGTQFSVTDVDGDGKSDVVVSNKKGLFVFR